jgi:hypothetical protein
MIYLLMANQTSVEVPDVMKASVEGDQIVCRSREGKIVAMIEASTVTGYGTNEALKNPGDAGYPLQRKR